MPTEHNSLDPSFSPLWQGMEHAQPVWLLNPLRQWTNDMRVLSPEAWLDVTRWRQEPVTVPSFTQLPPINAMPLRDAGMAYHEPVAPDKMNTVPPAWYDEFRSQDHQEPSHVVDFG